VGELTPEQAEVLRQLGPLDGERVAGGCDSCAAYRVVVPIGAGAWQVRVHHDPSCGFLAQRELLAECGAAERAGDGFVRRS
jgi:hypothetical protein